MTELEDRIRDVLTERSSRGELVPHLAPPVARRARRRQIGTVAVATVVVTALVVGLLGAVAYVRSGEDGPIPAVEGAGRHVSLDAWTIDDPAGWYLVEFPSGTEIQLTNFDPAFTRPCFSGDAVPLPRDGVLLDIEIGSGPVDGAGSPPPLVYDPAPSACREGGPSDQGDLAPGDPEHWSMSWTDAAAGPMDANAMFGADATDADRAAIADALAGLTVTPSPDGATGQPVSRLVLDVLDTPNGQAILTFDRDGSSGDDFISVSGATIGGGISMDRRVPEGDAATTQVGTAWGGLAWGTVTSDAARAEIVTRMGAHSPATLVPLPTSLGYPGQQAVWGAFDLSNEDVVSVLLFDGDGHALNEPRTPILESRTTIATGEDPEAGPWSLTLERTADGDGLAFEYHDHGGGSGCCLSPLDGKDLRLDGSGSGGDEPSNITALGSDALASVVYEDADGTRIDGLVYDMPQNEAQIPKVALVIVPKALGIDGTLIGYDAGGNELGRESLGELQGEEPPGPTSEIDEVWTLLRDARDAVGKWAQGPGDGSLDGLTAATIAELATDVTWNDSGSGKPVPHEVALRGVMPAGGDERTGLSGTTLVLVSATWTTDGRGVGDIFCIGVNIDASGGGNFHYGTQDAATYADCNGGWSEG